jgi:hypothetical protein
MLRDEGYDYPATMPRNGTAAQAANAYTMRIDQQDFVSSDIREEMLEATQEASQLMSRRLRQAQLAALRGAEAQMAAKKRLDAEMTTREKDPRLDVREPPSPSRASTASHGAFSTGMSTESRAAFEGSQCSEAESVHSQRSSASRSVTKTRSQRSSARSTEASQMKAKIIEAMGKLAQAREAASARRNPSVQAHDEICVPSSERPAPEQIGQVIREPMQIGQVIREPPRDGEPPREGAAWEAARLEVARALAEGMPQRAEVSESRLPTVSETRDVETLRPHQGQAGSLGLPRHKVRENERFAAAVHLQMQAQEAMKKRVEMSDIFRKQEAS